MNEHAWLDEYTEAYVSALRGHDVRPQVVAFRDLALKVKAGGGKLLFAGNGASASIASHGAVDFSKQGKVYARDFNEANLLTALANDYGFEQWMVRALDIYANPGDAVVLISSSGRSPNVVNAARFAKERGLSLVTFSGFAADNPLRQLGDINFWIDSRAYNIVECVHMIWLTMVCDLIIGQREYGVS
jgi:D-sedoheptulose 7-phosphate isomerase